VGFLVFIFVLAIGYWRHGLSGATLAIRIWSSYLIAWLILLGAVAILIWLCRRWTRQLSILVLATFVIVWVTLGSDNYFRDLLGLSLGGVFGLLTSPPFWNRFRTQGFRILRWQELKMLPLTVHAIVGVFGWIGLGIADLIYFRPLTMSVARFDALAKSE
jgi:MFS superfamily sulfate permease-like transporter